MQGYPGRGSFLFKPFYMNMPRILFFFFSVLVGFACSPPKKAPTPKNYTPKTRLYRSSAENTFRQKIVDYGQQFVGTNYKYAGRSPKTGFDCSGFTSYVLNEFGVLVSPASSIQATEGRHVPIDQVYPGDLIFFGESRKAISHVALVVTNNDKGILCVHSTTSRGVIVENVSASSYWKPKILFARDVISED